MCKEFASRSRVLLAVGLVGLLGVATAGCDDEDGLFDQDGGVRFVHALPDGGPVDVYVAGETDPIASGLAYGNSTEFQRLDTGLFEFEIREAGASPDTDPLVTTEPVDVFDDEEFSAVITGNEEAGPQAVVVRHDFDRDDDGPFINFVHAAPDAPAVGLDVGSDGSVEIESVEPFSTAQPGAFVVPNDDFLLSVVSEGEEVTSFTLPEIDENDEFLAVAIGRLGDDPRAQTGFNILLVDEQSETNAVAQNPVVFVTHAVPDAPPVDVSFVHEDEEFENVSFDATELAFGKLSMPFRVPPGTLETDVAVAGTDQIIFEQSTSDLDPGVGYLLVAAGQAANDDFELITLGTNFALDTQEPLLRLAHASPDAAAVDVALVEDGSLSTPPLAEDLDFGDENPEDPGASVPTGAQTIGLAEAGDTAPIAAFDVEVPESARLLGVVAGAVNPVEGEMPLQLFLVDTTVFPWELTTVPVAE